MVVVEIISRGRKPRERFSWQTGIHGWVDHGCGCSPSSFGAGTKMKTTPVPREKNPEHLVCRNTSYAGGQSRRWSLNTHEPAERCRDPDFNILRLRVAAIVEAATAAAGSTSLSWFSFYWPTHTAHMRFGRRDRPWIRALVWQSRVPYGG